MLVQISKVKTRAVQKPPPPPQAVPGPLAALPLGVQLLQEWDVPGRRGGVQHASTQHQECAPRGKCVFLHMVEVPFLN